MKILTPRNLVIFALLLPAVAIAYVFTPSTENAVSYDKVRNAAGEAYSKAIYDAHLNGKDKAAEGRMYFDAGLKSFDEGQDFKATVSARYQECIKGSAEVYCHAAAEAFTEGYFYSKKYFKRNQAYLFKMTQRDNWQSDTKQGKIPSYLIRND